MKKFFVFLLSCLILSCSKESVENIEESRMLASRNADNWTVDTPRYIVTDTLYQFFMNAPSSINYHGFSWNSNSSMANVWGDQWGLFAQFYEGGIYNIRLDFYDSSFNHYYLDDALTLSVFEKEPYILGMEQVERGITNTFNVNYNNIVSDYNVEWDIPNGLSYWKNGKQLYLTPTTTGTFEIKCRVVEQCPLHNDAGVHVSNWCTKTITVIDQMREDSWGVYNPVINTGGSLSFDLRYKSSTGGFRCYAMYYVVLYQGAYDGIYAPQVWEWEKAWHESYYHPPVIDEDYGFVYCDWDYLDNESSILIGQDELFSRRRTISNFPSGKTIDDIEYVILFVRDNKGSSTSQYSTECCFEYD